MVLTQRTRKAPRKSKPGSFSLRAPRTLRLNYFPIPDTRPEYPVYPVKFPFQNHELFRFDPPPKMLPSTPRTICRPKLLPTARAALFAKAPIVLSPLEPEDEPAPLSRPLFPPLPGHLPRLLFRLLRRNGRRLVRFGL